jgi:hypothetical protein
MGEAGSLNYDFSLSRISEIFLTIITLAELCNLSENGFTVEHWYLGT